MSTGNAGSLLRHVLRLLAGRKAAAPDGQLLERFTRERDEAAFAALVSRYGPLVLGVCRRVLHHEQDAEDVFQATFLVLARKAETIRRTEAVGSWLYGVAHRLALKARAGAARRSVHESRAPQAETLDPAADMTWRELQTVLDEELARLPDRYRAPLLLCYFDGQ